MTKEEFTLKCIESGREMTKAMYRVRRKHGITQKEIAKEIGVSADYIRKVEQNKLKVPAYIVYRYCKILHVSPETFFQTEEKTNDKIEWITEMLPALPENILNSIRLLIFQYIQDSAGKK